MDSFFTKDVLAGDEPLPAMIVINPETEFKKEEKSQNLDDFKQPNVISKGKEDMSDKIPKGDYLGRLSENFDKLNKKYKNLARECTDDNQKTQLVKFQSLWQQQKKIIDKTYTLCMKDEEFGKMEFGIKIIEFTKWIELYFHTPVKDINEFFESFYYYIYTDELPTADKKDVQLRVTNIIQIPYEIKVFSTNHNYTVDLNLFATIKDIKIYLQNHYEDIFLHVDRQFLYIDDHYTPLADDDVILVEYLKIFFQNIQNNNGPNKKDHRDCLPKIQLKWKVWCIDHIMNYNKSIQDININCNVEDNKEDVDLNTPMWKCLFTLYPNKKEVIEDIIQRGKKIKEKILAKHGADFLNHFSPNQLYAIFIYTTNLLYKDLNADFRNGVVDKWKDYARELVLGLRQLPFQWETGELPTVYRGMSNIVDVAKFLEPYKKDHIIQLEGFTSTSAKEKVAKDRFSGPGQILYEIKTWHGRKVNEFSNYGEEEEILIAPSSWFRVLGVEQTKLGGYLIKLLESPMPWCDKAILWVDDQPENNKSLMEDLERRGIMVVPRVSTHDAISLLDWMGKILHRDFSHFRIVTDMVRKEKSDPTSNEVLNYSAGAELIQKLQQSGYNNLVCIYCGDKNKAENNCTKHSVKMDNVLISTKEKEVLDFCTSKLMCMCGKKELKNFIASQCYSSNGVKCDNCNSTITPTDVVYHCNSQNESAHPNGYDLCLPCAHKFIKEKKSPQPKNDNKNMN